MDKASASLEGTAIYDCLVVGGGPCGLTVARKVAEKGFSVAVVEEHGEIGLPLHCAGLVSCYGARELGIPSHCILNRVRGARIYSPGGEVLEVCREEDVAVVVDRERLDKYFAKLAERCGAQIFLGCKIKDLAVKEATVSCLAAQGETLEARVVADAEGAVSRAAERFLGRAVAKEVLPGFQVEVEAAVDDDFVEVYLGEKWAPRFFAWLIPCGEGVARVGLACEGDTRQFLGKLLEKHPVVRRHRLGKVLKGFGGFVVVGGPLKRTVFERTILVGDAGGFVKPTTGGGLVYGVLTSKIAGEVIAGFLEGVSELEDFEQLWRQSYEQEFKEMKRLRRILVSLSDKELNKVLHYIIEEGLAEWISRTGDMDFQAKLISTLLRRPRLSLLLAKAVLKGALPF